MVVQHNMTAINANRYFGMNNNKLSKSLEKLSSGYAINRAGDNAAGLAVSEKMRSQIAGINQGVKNAQDGISMVQTYEGALTETDSILQRMKTLATQSANGTYQDDVDREAIQLEFNQLNDELNQIADTDFNGVVALNGGQMADGTKAVNGKFDYANGTKAATKLGKGDVNVVDSQLWDNTGAGTVTTANNAWKALNSQWTREPGKPETNGPDSVDITFKFNKADGTWSAINASNGASLSKVECSVATTNGGFGVMISGASVANVVVDQDKLGNGDTITLTFNNPANGISAPTNMGATVTDTTNFTAGNQGVTDRSNDLTVTKGDVADKDMTADMNEMFKLLDGATVEMSYTDKATAKGDMKITLNDGTVLTNKDDGTVTVGSTTFTFTATANGFEIGDGTNKLLTIEGAEQGDDSDPATGKKNATGSVTYKLGIENAKYDAAAKPSIEVAKTGNVSRSNSNSAASAPLTYTDNITLQVGARTKDSVNFSFEYASNGLGDLKADLDCSARGLGTDKLSLTTQESANIAIDKIDQALNKVSMVRGSFGAVQNRLEHKIDNLNTTSENLTSAESRIRDTNMAEEMMNFTKNQILSQASQSMLAQANQLPQGVLSLLQ
ncbi:MAG: flagellin [Oscillospiraceae bacterium]